MTHLKPKADKLRATYCGSTYRLEHDERSGWMLYADGVVIGVYEDRERGVAAFNAVTGKE